MLYYNNHREIQKGFQRLSFTNFAKDQGGMHQNMIKFLVKGAVLVTLLVYCRKLEGEVKVEKLEG